MRQNFSKPPPPYSSVSTCSDVAYNINVEKILPMESTSSHDNNTESTALFIYNSMAPKIYYSNSKISDSLYKMNDVPLNIGSNSNIHNFHMEDNISPKVLNDAMNINDKGFEEYGMNAEFLNKGVYTNDSHDNSIHVLARKLNNINCAATLSQLGPQLSDIRYSDSANYNFINPTMHLLNDNRHNTHIKTVNVLSPQETEAIAFRAARMVDMLSEENKALRKTIEQHSWKLSQIQKLEMDLEKTQKNHEILIEANEKREELEKALRAKMDQEIKKLRKANQNLLECLQQTAHTYLTNKQKINVAKHGSKLQNFGDNLANSNSLSTGSLESISSEFNKKDLVITQLIAQNKELIASNEKKDIEISAQKATLNEQILQLEVMQKAIIHAQSNILRLEEIIATLADHFPPFIKKLLKDQLLTSSSSTDAILPSPHLLAQTSNGTSKEAGLKTMALNVMANKSDPTLYSDCSTNLADFACNDPHQNCVVRGDCLSTSDNQLQQATQSKDTDFQYARHQPTYNQLQPSNRSENNSAYLDTISNPHVRVDFPTISDSELLPKIKALQSCLVQKENLIMNLLNKSIPDTRQHHMSPSLIDNYPKLKSNSESTLKTNNSYCDRIISPENVTLASASGSYQSPEFSISYKTSNYLL